MKPEEQARVKIDKQIIDAGWNIVSRDEYISSTASAVKEALMQGNTESDYLLFIDNKAIAVVEAKKSLNSLGKDVEVQAENYARSPQNWYGVWFPNFIPLVYLANGDKILFKNLLKNPDGEYEEIKEMHSPKKMLQLIDKTSEYGALPYLNKKGLRECQYNAEIKLEESLKNGKKKSLAVLATGAGKTYLACLASYRLLNYTPTKRVLFLVDRNNLARQTESEFQKFDRTEKLQKMSDLYQINRLRKTEDVNGDIVISTIQKLFAVMTGQTISETDEDEEDERWSNENEKDEKTISIGSNVKLSPNHFQFIVVDECHRSIYRKWQGVLKYFTGAKILGLTATPTPEANAFFNDNVIEKYTYEDSVVDGVNVPFRIYRIETEVTEHGSSLKENKKIIEISRKNNITNEVEYDDRVDYQSSQLDRSVINPDQIELVLKTFKDKIYEDLYPGRKKDWNYIPKTLIFAKDDNHATKIVESIKKIFKDEFKNGRVPEKFVRKITYSSGDSNELIRDFRTEKEFRIAVTVTLVATGTDIKPLEVVLFMKDVKSEVLYTQMKGRGCRTISDDKLKEVTPNAETKSCFYVVDAVGATESEKYIPIATGTESFTKKFSLEKLLEHLSHGELSDDNLSLLRDYCSSINRRYENNILFKKHLDNFINSFGFAPRTLSNIINRALDSNSLPLFISASEKNPERRELIDCLISNLDARNTLLEMQKGYYVISPEKDDKLISAKFSKEEAKKFIDSFEEYLNTNKDKVEALRIIYNSENVPITHKMLCDLRDKFLSANRLFTPYNIWSNYKQLDKEGKVEVFDTKNNVRALTNLIQIVRYAYKKSEKLTSLFGVFTQRFNLYCGQAQRELTDGQQQVMRLIAEYIVNEGAITITELNEIDTDLWRKAVNIMGTKILTTEMQKLSRFILKVA